MQTKSDYHRIMIQSRYIEEENKRENKKLETSAAFQDAICHSDLTFQCAGKFWNIISL